MCRRDSQTLALLGSGKQARNHLIAMNAIGNFSRVVVYSPTQEHREQFTSEMSALLKLKIEPIANAEEAVSAADIVLAATNTNDPVLSGKWLRDGTHVTSIVGSNVGMVQSGVIAHKRREIDDETLKRAAVIGIASRELAIQDQQGDIYDQVQAGELTWDDVLELRDIVSGKDLGRRDLVDVTVFKNNGGQGIAELAIANVIFTRARERKLGVEISWGEGY
jgi:alanine dehydrogenase